MSGAAWSAPSSTLASRTFSTPRHSTHYLESGPANGPLMMFLHGWPQLSLIWRAQMAAFAAEGWYCVAPDMRGYGGSSAPSASDAYTNEQVVADMAELHDHLGGKPAIWVGHDWGSVIVSSMVAHEPQRSRGAVLVSVPYFPDANALPTLVPLVDRTIYPADKYPDGQWDYYRYYTKHFDSAVADLDADKAASLASIYRRGDPASMGKPTPNALVTSKGGRFGAAHQAPPTEPDVALWPAADFAVLVSTFEAHGFRAPCAWYLNDDANIAYAHKAPNNGHISQPVLFINGDLDTINTINGNRSGDPMRAACADLTITNLRGAHWLPIERKQELVREIQAWLQSKKL
ncbi:alpha/beta hydrolase [Burkholderia sp. PAMC 26561]|uniref:alpha/beta hydrolase n=1 Tax=Burkholderia sp. PAMC 26561 TaxID=1795043 RepID=UPI00076B20BB|nr:alpha/beta hydrolase [Burkholderia sp. PAMC 26561]AME28162.1 alpha/beta hydrolase [Burkholderia sp. PAMC 26561]